MRSRLILGILIICAFVWGLWADYSIPVARYFTDDPTGNVQAAGSWGDTFAPLAALISAVGTVLLILTLIVQRQAIADQAADLHRQRFESSFFELLKLLRQLREELVYRFSPQFIQWSTKRIAAGKTAVHGFAAIIGDDGGKFNPGGTVRGRNAITAALIDARFYLNRVPVASIDRDKISEIYMDHVQPRAESTFSPYFRVVYTILDRLRDDKVIDDNDKNRYSRLLRSQLTSHELSLIAINATAPVAKDFFNMLVQFRLLKYHPPSTADDRLRRIYPPIAFEARSDHSTQSSPISR